MYCSNCTIQMLEWLRAQGDHASQEASLAIEEDRRGDLAYWRVRRDAFREAVHAAMEDELVLSVPLPGRGSPTVEIMQPATIGH